MIEIALVLGAIILAWWLFDGLGRKLGAGKRELRHRVTDDQRE